MYYPEEEEDCNKSQRIERLPESEFCGLRPLVIARLDPILLKDAHRGSPLYEHIEAECRGEKGAYLF